MISTVDIIKSYILNEELYFHDNLDSRVADWRLVTCKLAFYVLRKNVAAKQLNSAYEYLPWISTSNRSLKSSGNNKIVKSLINTENKEMRPPVFPNGNHGNVSFFFQACPMIRGQDTWLSQYCSPPRWSYPGRLGRVGGGVQMLLVASCYETEDKRYRRN